VTSEQIIVPVPPTPFAVLTIDKASKWYESHCAPLKLQLDSSPPLPHHTFTHILQSLQRIGTTRMTPLSVG